MQNELIEPPSDRAGWRAADELQCAEEHLAMDLNAAIANTTNGYRHLSLEPFEVLIGEDGKAEFGLRVKGVKPDPVAIAALVMEWAKRLAIGK